MNTDYGYDNAGRLRTVKVANSLEATYTYDAFDRLAIRTLTNQTPSGTTHFIHMLGGGGAFDDLAPGLGEQLGGFGNRIIGETNGAGVLTREYAWIDDRIVAVLADANAAEPLLWWVTNDHLGRPVQMTDSSQAVVWRAAYRPFGEVISVAGPASLDARFPGQWFQLESGLAYNWHRHYDASLGRYTQADPLGVKAGPSVYGYAGGNPVMGVDPEGLTTLTFNRSLGILTVDPEQAGNPPYSIPASSGRPNCGCDETKMDAGPIPAGGYTARVSDISNPGWIGNILRNSLGDWGSWRVPLIPNTGTNTYGRSGFFLHGGTKPGSAGCIDFGGGQWGDARTNKLHNDMRSDPDGIIPVHVE